MKIDGYSTSGRFVPISPERGITRDSGLGFEMVGLQMGLCEDEEGGMQRARCNVLLKRLDLPALVFDPRVHSLDV